MQTRPERGFCAARHSCRLPWRVRSVFTMADDQHSTAPLFSTRADNRVKLVHERISSFVASKPSTSIVDATPPPFQVHTSRANNTALISRLCPQARHPALVCADPPIRPSIHLRNSFSRAECFKTWWTWLPNRPSTNSCIGNCHNNIRYV